jgi:hypothetical protein
MTTHHRSNRPTSSFTGTRHGRGLNTKERYEKYVALAQAAALTGDAVETENYYQHAEHYFRLMQDRTE